jgi:signal transduction histidine kinase
MDQKKYPVDKISQQIGIERDCLIKALNFVPYPFLLSEYRAGVSYNVFVNDRFMEEIGYTCEEIPTIDDWFAKAYPDQTYRDEIIKDWRTRIDRARDTGLDSVIKQARIQTKAGGTKWYEVKASMQGRINFVVFVNIDDEINRELELERLNDNKNRILSILSHDLRSPLNNLRAVVNLAADVALSHREQNDILKRISQQVFQMTELLDTTLHCSKSNFSNIHPEREAIVVRAIVDRYLDLYSDAIGDKLISVVNLVQSNGRVWSDPEIISIVLRNLISNAIKYTRKGGMIRIVDLFRNGSYSLVVENSGSGISSERIQQLKTGVYTSEPGSNNEKGLGLGLKLCQQLLDHLGGRLEIEGTQKTALFRIVLFDTRSTMGS